MPATILGLDIGGANLKAATADKRAVSVPFALWKQPDRLPAALAELVGRFPDADELAVTMTGELCDCYETKREGVNAILDATEFAAKGRRVRVWSTDGAFVSVAEARTNHLKVAAANWHALATFAGRFMKETRGLLIDTGSTTTDIIPMALGKPFSTGKTDEERFQHFELAYIGVRRTPIYGILGFEVAAELFATTLDAYLLQGKIADDAADTDTADGRPATQEFAHARMARMKCSDREAMTLDSAKKLAAEVNWRIELRLSANARHALDGSRLKAREWDYGKRYRELPFHIITSGTGAFLARAVADTLRPDKTISLNDELGPAVSACAPAYALAVLATERP